MLEQINVPIDKLKFIRGTSYQLTFFCLMIFILLVKNTHLTHINYIPWQQK